MYFILYFLVGLGILTAFYVLFQSLNVLRKVSSLRRRIRRLEKKGYTVTPLRGFWGIFLGDKGGLDYRIITPTGAVEVSILSFLSTHGRWNILEKYDLKTNTSETLLEVRRYNRWFYKAEKHSEMSEANMDLRRETLFRTVPLRLAPRDGEDPTLRSVLLVHPRPRLMTRTVNHMDYVNWGETLEGYELLTDEKFFDSLEA